MPPFPASDGLTPPEVVEEFRFEFSYSSPPSPSQPGSSAPSFRLTAPGVAPPAHRLHGGACVATLRAQACAVLRLLISSCATLGAVPEERDITAHLFFVDGTPPDYQPPGFVAAEEEALGSFACVVYGLLLFSIARLMRPRVSPPPPPPRSRAPTELRLGSLASAHHGLEVKVRSALDGSDACDGGDDGGGGDDASPPFLDPECSQAQPPRPPAAAASLSRGAGGGGGGVCAGRDDSSTRGGSDDGGEKGEEEENGAASHPNAMAGAAAVPPKPTPPLPPPPPAAARAAHTRSAAVAPALQPQPVVAVVTAAMEEAAIHKAVAAPRAGGGGGGGAAAPNKRRAPPPPVPIFPPAADPARCEGAGGGGGLCEGGAQPPPKCGRKVSVPADALAQGRRGDYSSVMGGR